METVEDIIKEIREIAHNISVADDKTLSMFRPVAALARIADRLEAAYKDKAEKMNSLYFASIMLRESQMEFWGRLWNSKYAQMREAEKSFDEILEKITGHNPLRPNLPLSASDVCSTVKSLNVNNGGEE